MRQLQESGLNNLSWDEFQGVTVSVWGGAISGDSEPRGPYEGYGASVYSGPGIKLIPTTGSLLVLDFGNVIQLTEDYLAPGAWGNST